VSHLQSFQFSTTQKIVCEAGSLKSCARYCLELGIKRPIIVSDQGIYGLGFIDELQSALHAGGISYSLFKDTIADPPESVVLQAVNLAVVENADGVIGIGGGSSMDCAKLVAVLMLEKQNIKDIYGLDNVKGARAPLILIPTTAGTGSEVTPIAIVTTGETTKAGIVSNKLIPDIALLDASLTLGLPASITASTGIDAMVHAIEAFTGKHKKNLFSDVLAKQALSLLAQNIEEVCTNGSNLEARQNMLLGACFAGQAFANSPVGAVHALAYPLGGQFHVPHGLSNALVLPHVIRFNNSHACELYAELVPLILPNSTIKNTDTNKRSGELANYAHNKRLAGESLADYFDKLSHQLNLPTTLRELNISQTDLPLLAKDAMQQTRLLVNNPREVTLEDALNIYQQAL
jgi:alcohol dehydrogenase class IV